MTHKLSALAARRPWLLYPLSFTLFCAMIWAGV
jgi:hypothetical protein